MITKCINDGTYICLGNYNFCNWKPADCSHSELSGDFLDEIPVKPKHVTSFSEYQIEAHKTCMKTCWNEAYLTYGLISEIGKIADKLKKNIRDGNCKIDDEFKKSLAYELGDVCWYVAELGFFYGYNDETISIEIKKTHEEDLLSIMKQLSLGAYDFLSQSYPVAYESLVDDCGYMAHEIGYTLTQILNMNLEKLASRKIRNKIKGEGDNR